MFPFPIPEAPEPTQIYWDSRLNSFRNNVTGQFVSRLEGIQTLFLSRVEGESVLTDAFGTAVPPLSDLIPKRFDLPFINQLRQASFADFDVYGTRAPEGSYYLTMATYTDDKGQLRVTLVASKGGEAVNSEDERRRIAAAIAVDTGLAMGAKGTDKIVSQVRSIWHFTVTKR